MKDVTIQISHFDISGSQLSDVRGTLDVSNSEDFPISLTLGVADIKNMTARSGSFSKDFEIPATDNNNEVLNYLQNINIDDQKQIRELKDASILVNGITQLNGQIKIKNPINRAGAKFYKATFIADNSEWISLMKEEKISDYTYTDPVNGLTHSYTKANIEASWSGTVDTDWDYVYPLIHYGKWQKTTQVSVEDMKPAVYMRAILEKAFISIGYNLSSTFLDSANFKKLVFPFIGKAFILTPAEILSRKFRAGISSDKFIDISSALGNIRKTNLIKFDDDSTGANFDNGGNFNTVLFRYVCPAAKGGKYKFEAQIEVFRRGTPSLLGSLDGQLTFYKNTFAPTNRFAFSPIQTWKREQGGTTNQNIEKRTRQFKLESDYVDLVPGDIIVASLDTEKSFFYQSLIPSPGDLRVRSASAISFIPSDDLEQNMPIFFRNVPSNEIRRNNDITVNQILPETPMLDIINGVTHVFNLQWWTDSATKTVFVEPKDDFLNGTTTALNWTTKLDLKKEYSYEFVEGYKRDVELSYLEDSNDKFLARRNEIRGTTLGAYTNTFPDRFPQGVQKLVNPTFAPTYHIVDATLHPDFNSSVWTNESSLKTLQNNTIAIARLWSEAQGDLSAPLASFNFKPRILFFEYANQTDANGTTPQWRWEGTTQTLVPFAVFNVISEVSSTFSLSFSSISNTGKVGRFEDDYATTFRTVEDGKILTAFFNLTEVDILNFDPRELIFLEQDELYGYYSVNFIKDYAPTRDRSTKVELVKVRNEDPVPVDTAQSDEDGGGIFSEDDSAGGGVIAGGQTGGLSMGSGVDTDFALAAIPLSSNEAPSFVLNNGSNNQAQQGSGSAVIGWSSVSTGQKQTILGAYNNPNPSDAVQIGGGTSNDERVNVMAISKDGIFRLGGGEVLVETNNTFQNVWVELDGKLTKVTLSDGN